MDNKPTSNDILSLIQKYYLLVIVLVAIFAGFILYLQNNKAADYEEQYLFISDVQESYNSNSTYVLDELSYETALTYSQIEYKDFEGELINLYLDNLVFWNDVAKLTPDEQQNILNERGNRDSFVLNNLAEFLLENKDTNIYSQSPEIIFTELSNKLTVSGRSFDSEGKETLVTSIYFPEAYSNDLEIFINTYIPENEREAYLLELDKLKQADNVEVPTN